MLEAKAKCAAPLSDLKVKELDAQAEIAETVGICAHDQSLDNGRFVNALRVSVLLVITYLFFLLFAAIKGSTVHAMIAHQNIDLSTVLMNAWDNGDRRDLLRDHDVLVWQPCDVESPRL